MLVLFWIFLSTFWWLLDVCQTRFLLLLGACLKSCFLRYQLRSIQVPFIYNHSKNLVPSFIDAFEKSTVWVLQNVVFCLKYILYCFFVPDAQGSKISFSTLKFKWFLFHRLSKLVSSVFSSLGILLLVGLVSKGWFP